MTDHLPPPEHARRSATSAGIPIEAGEVVIRARLLFVIAPGLGSRSRIDWSAEGDARFPIKPLWTRGVDLEHTIIVSG